jgi:hypothetical protein
MHTHEETPERAATAACISWDRLPEETDRAWRAFEFYKRAGGLRTVAGTAKELGFGSRRQCARYASRHDWKARARAWDARLSAAAEESALDEARAMGVRHVAAATAAVDLTARWFDDLLAAPDRLAALKPADVARFLELGVRIERLARGLPTDRVESKNEVEATVEGDARSAEIDGLSFEDLMADPVMRRVLAELDREQADARDEDDGPWAAEQRRERIRAV